MVFHTLLDFIINFLKTLSGIRFDLVKVLENAFVITETPSETAVRTLKLIAKALQNLANLVEFGVKEQFMTCVNPFIKNNKARMVEFLDKLSVSCNMYGVLVNYITD